VDACFNRQSGQATAELVASLIGILAVFTGFLMIVDIGVAKVENVSSARGESDQSSYDSESGGSGSPIRYWSAGDDGFHYTEDDQPIVATSENPDTFADELTTGEFSLFGDFSRSYVENNFATSLDPDSVFLPAANLVSATKTSSVELDGATRALYFDTPSLSLSDTVYMPVID